MPLLPLILAIIIPSSLILWIFNVFVHTFYTSSSDHGLWEPLSPSRCMLAMLIPFYIAKNGIAKGSLSQSGAVAGVIIGFIMTISNYCFFSSLLAFFITGSRATKFRQEKKAKLEENYKESSRRNWMQVICNGGPAAQLAIVFMLEVGCGEPSIDFVHHYTVSWLCMSVLGALACANGDTFASEIGSVAGWGEPRLITNFQKVPRGTNGAVSLAGTLASIVGGVFVGGAYHAALVLVADIDRLEEAPPQWPIILIAAIAGFLGSIVDSLLGATLQYSGFHKEKKCVVETPGPDIKHICGLYVFDNHSVNLLASTIMALITPHIALSLWGYLS